MLLHTDSRAKYAVAFFKMSRCILTRASSALKRASSICFALTGLAPAPVSLPFAASLTQFSRVCFGMPNTLAVAEQACHLNQPCSFQLLLQRVAALLPFLSLSLRLLNLKLNHS